MIRINVNTKDAVATLRKLANGLDISALDRVADRVALQTFADVKSSTPVRWTGTTRNAWQMATPAIGSRLVFNDSKVMLFLEEGTGQSTGGRIYPKVKKFLYVPLRPSAMIWRPGLKFGVDFILAKSVRGISPRHIVKQAAERAKKRLQDAMENHLRSLING